MPRCMVIFKKILVFNKKTGSASEIISTNEKIENLMKYPFLGPHQS